jgi:hypothetical protein
LQFACHEPSSCFASHTVDDATVAFIRGWMLHLVKGIMDNPHHFGSSTLRIYLVSFF